MHTDFKELVFKQHRYPMLAANQQSNSIPSARASPAPDPSAQPGRPLHLPVANVFQAKTLAHLAKDHSHSQGTDVIQS